MKFKYVRCNICGSAKAMPMGRRKGPDGNINLETDIVRCQSCGLIYPNPMPHFEENEIQGNFGKPEEYFPREADRRLEAFANILRGIEGIKRGKGRVLDVGCGRGEFLHVAGKMGWNAVGTEISKAFADYAKNKFGLNVLTGDLRDIDLRPESFDVICLISVIQYLQDPMETLKKISSLLKKDGIIFIEATNDDALVFKAGNLFEGIKGVFRGQRVTTQLSPLFPSYQVYGFNKKSLSLALEKAGLKIYRFKVAGMTGGGRMAKKGFTRGALDLIRKIVLFFGGLTGNGHVMVCMAKKG